MDQTIQRAVNSSEPSGLGGNIGVEENLSVMASSSLSLNDRTIICQRVPLLIHAIGPLRRKETIILPYPVFNVIYGGKYDFRGRQAGVIDFHQCLAWYCRTNFVELEGENKFISILVKKLQAHSICSDFWWH